MRFYGELYPTIPRPGATPVRRAVVPSSPPPARVAAQAAPWPRMVRLVAHYRQPADKGIGDTLERLLKPKGGDAIKRITKRLGVECGCSGRQARLNRLYPYL